MPKSDVKEGRQPPIYLTADKPRERIVAQRDDKRATKQAKEQQQVSGAMPLSANTSAQIGSSPSTKPKHTVSSNTMPTIASESRPQTGDAYLETATNIAQSREQIKALRNTKKMAKLAAKQDKESVAAAAAPSFDTGRSINKNTPAEQKKKTTKAERRAIQEAQRAAKSSSNGQRHNMEAEATGIRKSRKEDVPTSTADTQPTALLDKSVVPTRSQTKTYSYNVKLFHHLMQANKDANLFVNNPQIHPIVARLGEQYAKRIVVGSTARCIAFLNALRIIIKDFETPPKKEFARSLETFVKDCVEHLHKCRPLAVSVSNAYKHIKHFLTQLPPHKLESELKESLCHFIDTYLENQVGKAALAISYAMQQKISDGDVILTFGCSSLISYIFEEAHRRLVDFRVIVVDSRPFLEGQELLRRLCANQIACTYVFINGLSFVMPEVTKILLGAHALLSNGYVMARTGTAQVALVGRAFNVPVMVCCETHKFSERLQMDAIVYNELGDPNDLLMGGNCSLANWQETHKVSPLNLNYDITPPELVTAVVTEVSILPCTSVPVILRIKPTEIGYYN